MAKLASILQEKYNHEVLVVLPYKGTGSEVLDEYDIKNVLVLSYDWTARIAERDTIKFKMKHIIKEFFNYGAIYKG